MLGVLLLCAHAQASGNDGSEVIWNPDTKVLILGAGAAGISAARFLSENNETDFLIVEGTKSNRYDLSHYA
jgi:malic enzyme